jgi:hypothetical protein
MRPVAKPARRRSAPFIPPLRGAVCALGAMLLFAPGGFAQEPPPADPGPLPPAKDRPLPRAKAPGGETAPRCATDRPTDDLTAKLDDCESVLVPPDGVDPEMAEPPPQPMEGQTPVIEPDDLPPQQ